jgi:putative flippase GtrA
LKLKANQMAQACGDLRLLKPAALGGPTPAGVAVVNAGAGYSLYHHAGTIALGVGFIVFVFAALIFYFGNWQWTFQKSATGEVTTQKNVGMILGIAFLLGVVFGLIAFFLAR